MVAKYNLTRIEEQYNPEFDMIPNGPSVTWAEKGLAEAVSELLDRINKLEKKLEMVTCQHEHTFAPGPGEIRCQDCGIRKVETMADKYTILEVTLNTTNADIVDRMIQFIAAAMNLCGVTGATEKKVVTEAELVAEAEDA